MRRNRGTAIQLALFALALILILYVNQGPSSTSRRIFDWSTVRYQTTASSLPQARGVCPGLASSKKPALVVARTSSEDSAWLTERALADRYHLCIYTADAPSHTTSNELQTPANRGHEAMAYLTFMIDNYQSIPSAGAVFVHGSRFAWHNDDPTYDNFILLQRLNMSRALGKEGYHNLRCDWSTSMCPPEEAKPQASFETKMRASMEGGNVRAVSDAALADALVNIFGNGVESEKGNELRMSLGRSDAVRAQCCAQFVVSRENILRHGREEYVALRQWLLDGSRDSNDGTRADDDLDRHLKVLEANRMQKTFRAPAPADDLIAGRVLSYVWHILFLPTLQQTGSAVASGVDLNSLNTMACPRAEDCYCRLYGRCSLEGCKTPGRCNGQYHVPMGYKLPPDWAQKHS